MHDIFSQIFPPIPNLPEAVNVPRLREEILTKLYRGDEAAESYRNFCYGADLLLRQFDMVRKEQGKQFSYRTIPKISCASQTNIPCSDSFIRKLSIFVITQRS